MPAPSKPKKDKRVELPQEEMDTLEVSQSPLRSASHGDVKADLLQHHARLEKLLLEMLVKIQQTISETVRAEVAQLPRQTADGLEGCRSEISIGPKKGYLTVEQGDLNKSLQSLPGVISNENQSAEPSPPTQVRTPSFVSWAAEVPDGAETRDSKVKKENTLARPSRLTMRVPWKLEKTKVTGVKEILAQVSRKRSQVNSSSDSWPAWRRAAKTIVNSTVFEWFCASLILLCAVLVGVQAHWDIQSIGVAPPEVFRVLNTGFNLLFTVELILRVMVEGLLFFSWYNPSIHWNAMDAGLVTVALVEESIMLVAASTESVDLSGLKVLRTLRLARILRIVKVVRFFSELRIMVNGVIGSARSLCWALLLILLVNFLFGVFFMQLSIDYLETKEDQVKARMLRASAEVKAWANANCKLRLPSRWRFTKTRLGLKQNKFVHYHGKGFHVSVLLSFLNAFLEDKPLETELKMLVWSGDTLMSFLHNQRKDGLLLTEHGARQVLVLGEYHMNQLLLANRKFRAWPTYKLFNVRPKFHSMSHILEFSQSRRNPVAQSCWMEEDWIRTVANLAKKTHQRKTQLSTLQRYAAGPLPFFQSMLHIF